MLRTRAVDGLGDDVMSAYVSDFEARNLIEEAIEAFDPDIAWRWSWGCGPVDREPDRSYCGLQGHWLAVLEEAGEVASRFSALRERLETLECLSWIEVRSCGILADGAKWSPLTGELWRFHFKPHVEEMTDLAEEDERLAPTGNQAR